MGRDEWCPYAIGVYFDLENSPPNIFSYLALVPPQGNTYPSCIPRTAGSLKPDLEFLYDTTATGVVLGTRFSQQWLTEQHLYGSARLGIDRERRLLADSVLVRRAVFNPIVGWWKEVSVGVATEFGVGNQPEIPTRFAA